MTLCRLIEKISCCFEGSAAFFSFRYNGTERYGKRNGMGQNEQNGETNGTVWAEKPILSTKYTIFEMLSKIEIIQVSAKDTP